MEYVEVGERVNKYPGEWDQSDKKVRGGICMNPHYALKMRGPNDNLLDYASDYVREIYGLPPNPERFILSLQCERDEQGWKRIK